MRTLVPILALLSALAAGAARAGDGAAVSPEVLQQLRATQQQRNSVEPARREPATVESHLAKGDAQRDAGDHARALWSYLLAHQLDREDVRPLGRIATLHLSREPERADVIFRQLLLEDEGSALARTGLGLALMARGRFPEAIAELRTAVDEDGELAAAHDALGVAFDREQQRENARWHYRRAAELQPRSHEPWNNLGVSYLASGDFPAAAEALEQATRLEPRDAAAWNNLGLARGRERAYGPALDAFRRAGDERAAHNNLGYVQYLNGDHELALASYERALHADGRAEDRLQVLRNARLASEAKLRPRPAARAPAPDPGAGTDAPGLGAASGLVVEDGAPPAATAGTN
jgi:Flp pilus assembly protein TadD